MHWPILQICVNGGLRTISVFWPTSDVRYNVVVPDLLNRTHLQGFCLGKQAVKISCSDFMEHSECSGSQNLINRCSFQKELDDHQLDLSSNGSYRASSVNETFDTRTGDIQFVESSSLSAKQEELLDFTNQLIDETDISPESVNPDSVLTMDVIQENPSPPPDTFNADAESMSSIKTGPADIVAETKKSISDLVNEGQSFLNSSLDKVISSIRSATREASEAVDNATGDLMSATDRTGELAGNKLSAFSSDLKEASGRLGIAAVDALRGSIVVVEESLAKGFTSAAYGYGSVKELLPAGIQDALDASENKLAEFLGPVGSAFQQVC